MKRQSNLAVTFAVLAATTCLAGIPTQAAAQPAGAQTLVAAPAAAAPVELVRTITISGAQRLEADTIRSYIRLKEGDRYTQAAADQVLKDLYATELSPMCRCATMPAM